MPDASTPTAAIDGSADIARAIADLASSMPERLRPLAAIAYDYSWSWTPGAGEIFASLDPDRWELVQANPVRLLHELSMPALERAASNDSMVAAAHALEQLLQDRRNRPPMATRADAEHPVAFLCAEFAIHRSLPIYAGGLGVLAGDILKEASDLALPLVGVGLLYRQGYFLQRLDQSGYQHEYWMPVDPDRVPAALVHNEQGEPLTIRVPLRGRDIAVQIWRVDVGSVPLYLLDAERPENSRIDRWITSRLYVGDRATRLAQYALIGVGSIRALTAMGMEPSVVHLNEGHGGLAPLELAHRAMEAGQSRHEAFSQARDRTVFTTHTPVAAGNEGYDSDEISDVLGDYPAQVGIDSESFLQLGRTQPDNPHEAFVMTPLGIKMSHFANGVSRRHGEVARQMWQPLFPERPVDAVPIGHVTNGVHVPTWIAGPMRELLDEHLGLGWIDRAADVATWAPIADIPDEKLWAVRNRLRAQFVDWARDRTIANRLARSSGRPLIEAAERGFRPDVLTIGFARRLATYKRIYILTMEPQRMLEMLSDHDRPLQMVLAGKAHPADEDGKRSPQGIFELQQHDAAAEKISFLDNYDLEIGHQLVAGCDLWVNLPRPPLEASGTSGMKAVLNGGINLSVLDGWWAEAFDGSNGWGINGDVLYDPTLQDTRDAASFLDLLEHEVLPAFYTRDDTGIPRSWIARMKASLMTCGPQFSATRMVNDYIDKAYNVRERRR